MRTRTFVGIRTSPFYRVGNCHDQGPLAQPRCVVCASECRTPRGSPQRTAGGSPPGGSCTGGGWFSGGSCSGIGGGSTGGNVGSSILGSGVSAGIGIVIGVASFVLSSIGGQPRGRFDSRPAAAYPPELFFRTQARTYDGPAQGERRRIRIRIKQKSVHRA